MSAGWDRLRLFNLGELLAHRGRTALSLIVMAVSAALLVAVLSISGSVTGSVDALTRSLAGAAELEVTGVTDAGFEQSLLPAIAATPGVAHAVPMLRTQVGTGANRQLLIGADASIGALDSALTAPMAGQAGKLLTVPRGVLVGAATGHAEGDTFPLGLGEVTVAGVLDDDTSAKLNGGHLVVAPLPLAQLVTDRPGRLDSIQVVLAPGADPAAVRTALTAAVGGRAVVADPGLRTVQASGAIQIVRYSTLMSSAAALIVSAFLIYNAMSMAVAQRRPTLSLLRAMGAARGPMVRDLLAEAAVIGLIGGALGAVLGTLIGRGAIDALPAAILESVEARTEYLVPWYAIPLAVAACVIAAVVAAAVAARQVYRVAPVEALVPLDAGTTEADSRGLRIAAGALGAALVAVAIVVATTDLGRYSLAAVSLSFTASVLLAFAATRPIVRATAAVAGLFGAPGTLGATTLERAPRRVWATAMTVLIGVAATVAVGGAGTNMVDSATTTFDQLAENDFYVSPASLEQFPTGPLLPPTVRDEVARLPGVAGVRPAQMAFATLGTGRIMLQGYAATDPGSPNWRAVRPDVLPGLATGDGVVISRDIARTLGVGEGDRISLPTPSGTRTVTVLEVIPYFSAISGVVMLDLDHMRDWYQRPGETILAVDLAPGADPAAVRAELQRAIPPELYVTSGDDSVEAISSSMRQGSALSTMILWIVVLVSTVALLNTLMLSVLERRRELGVLRAIGTGRRFLLRSVLAEAAGIGLVGAVLGLAVGAAVQYLATLAMGHAMTIDIVYRPGAITVLYGAIALGLAMLGAIPPALRAARMPVVEALAVD
ncbi:ABC transporter permease [Nocardia asteroides]|uniref:ABC transporter permease n=1 Tax=Nocardia asteroides TaxID=1824 RepID=UPI001E3E5176|nr:FtsX-like permease family protein [Nocardia asteroides]UGT63803.1 ABC transporter permease [Nocardia asteroides]